MGAILNLSSIAAQVRQAGFHADVVEMFGQTATLVAGRQDPQTGEWTVQAGTGWWASPTEAHAEEEAFAIGYAEGGAHELNAEEVMVGSDEQAVTEIVRLLAGATHRA